MYVSKLKKNKVQLWHQVSDLAGRELLFSILKCKICFHLITAMNRLNAGLRPAARFLCLECAF